MTFQQIAVLWFILGSVCIFGSTFESPEKARVTTRLAALYFICGSIMLW